MSRLSQAFHDGGLLGSVGSTVGGLLMAPFHAIGNELDNIRAQPEILRAALEQLRARQAAYHQFQAQMTGQGGPPDPTGGIMSSGGGSDMLNPMTDPIQTGPPPGAQGPPQGPPDATTRYRNVAPTLATLAVLGSHGAGPAGSILNDAQPTSQNFNGVPVDSHTGAPMGPRVGVNLQNVNGFARDTQDPANANQFTPQLAQGEEPLYDQHGNITAVRNISGAIQSLAEREGTTAGARTANSVINGTGPDGRPFTGYAGSALGRPPGLGGVDAPAAGGQGGGGVISGQSPTDQNYGMHTAENAATRYNGYITAGQTAGQQITNLQGLGSLLQGFDGNPTSPAFLRLAEVAQSFGVRLGPNTSREEAARVIASGMALALHSQMPGPMSNADRNYLDGMVPGLAMTAAGRERIIDAQTRMAERQQFVAQAAQRWNDHYGRIDAPDSSGRHFEDYVTLYNQRNRIFPAQRTLRPPGVR